MFFDARSVKLLTLGQHIVIDGCPGLRLTGTDQNQSSIPIPACMTAAFFRFRALSIFRRF